MNRFERHRNWTIGAIWALGLVAVLAGTESILRRIEDLSISQPGLGNLLPARYIEFREWQPGMKFRAAPPPRRREHPGGPVLDVYPMDIDADGFIMPSRVHKDADLTIAFLGGSTTETMYVAPEQRFPYLVGRILEQRTGLKINSINASRSGNDAMLCSAIMTGKLVPMHPDYVVIMSNGTDLGVLSHFGTYWNASTDFAVLRVEATGVSRALGLLRNALLPATYRAYRHATLRLRTLFGSRAPPNLPSLLPPEASAGRDQWRSWGRDYGSALQQLVEVARAWHLHAVLLTEPSAPIDAGGVADADAKTEPVVAESVGAADFSTDGFSDAHEYFNGIARRVALRSGVGLIDLAPAARWSHNELYDGAHFTDAGSVQAAAIIADALEKMIASDRERARDRTTQTGGEAPQPQN